MGRRKIKNKISLLRRLYGGTERKQHRKLSRHLAFLCLLGIPVLIIYLLNNYIIIEPWRLGLLYLVPLFCFAQEHWATADRDLAENSSNYYWYFYGGIVKHRKRWSHSLCPGTPIRFMYGFWPLAGLFIYLPADVFFTCLALAFGGALINDTGHFLLDDFSLIEVFVGKLKKKRSGNA